MTCKLGEEKKVTKKGSETNKMFCKIERKKNKLGNSKTTNELLLIIVTTTVLVKW